MLQFIILFKELVRRWRSILHHVTDVHEWVEDGISYSCYHAPMTEEDRLSKDWIDADSEAFKDLKAIVYGSNLTRDLMQMNHFKHTGETQEFAAPCKSTG